jgi:prepilin-type N-terminal cleavage/methylation domain-containing protein
MTASGDSRRGTTLLEVLIAVAVTAILSGIVLTYGSGGRKQVNLYVETVKLSQIILRAKSQAVLIYYNPTSPTCGYGVRVNRAENAYALFRYQAAAGEDCNTITSIADANYVELERSALSPGVVFSPEDTGDVRDILFVPPDPKIQLWGKDGRIAPSGVIRLTTDDRAADHTITLTTGGQISY